MKTNLYKKRKEIEARIPKLDKVEQPKFDKVMAQLNTLVWKEIDMQISNAPAACTRTLAGTYVLYASKAGNEIAYNELKMHEAGHILKQHLKDTQYKHKMAERQIRLKWEKFKEHIDTEGHKDDELTSDFVHLVMNVVQDFEINSDYWPTKEEWEVTNKSIANAGLHRAVETANEKKLEEIEKWMNEKPEEIDRYSEGFHPCNFNFPSGLTWLAYLHLILTKPNDFMKNMNKALDNQAQRESEGGGQGQGNGQSGNGSKKISASAIKKAAKGNDVDNQQIKTEAQKQESGSKLDTDADGFMKGSGKSNREEDINTKFVLDKSVIKFIEKNCVGKILTRDRQDALYNYNRGKSGNGVLRTKSTIIEEHRPGNLVALIDVSGSVEIDLVKALILQIVKYKSKFGNKSRVILWDTELVADIELNKKSINSVTCGGGTQIASGIEYASKYLKSSADKLCIISDFQDNLEEWGIALDKKKFDVFSICWSDEDGYGALRKLCPTNKVVSRMRNINVAA